MALPKLFLQFLPKFQGTDVNTQLQAPPCWRALMAPSPPGSSFPLRTSSPHTFSGKGNRNLGIQEFRNLGSFLASFSEPQTCPGAKGLHRIPTLCSEAAALQGDSQKYHPEMNGIMIWRGWENSVDMIWWEKHWGAGWGKKRWRDAALRS